MISILVAGFGPFGEVVDNPASRIAEAVDGSVVDGIHVVGRVMPVSYRRSIEQVSDWVAELAPMALVGIGVAMDRSHTVVERTACRPMDKAQLDIDGEGPIPALQHPAQVTATIDVDALAEGLGAVVGDDAGRYVCNAWLYEAVLQLGTTTPVGFIHIPPSGLSKSRLLEAISRGWGAGEIS